MKTLPILFSGPMIRAILAGRKTQTRRVIKQHPLDVVSFVGAQDLPTYEYGLCLEFDRVISKHIRCPYGQPGDRLWVREEWATSIGCDDKKPSILETPGNGYGWPVWFSADNFVWWRGASIGGPAFMTCGKWRRSFFMPRWASRITLEITDIRVQRLQEISEEDAIAEGMTGTVIPDVKSGFRVLWDSFNGKRPGCSWDANPFVWAVSFKRVQP